MKRYISVLLAAFMFVLGMMGTRPVYATAGAIGNMVGKQVAESLLADVLEPVNSLDDQLKIEGSQNLKHIEKGEDGVFKGDIAKGQKIIIHYFWKVYPLNQVNEKRRVKGYNPIEYYNWTCTLHLKAKNGNKVIKEVQKTYKNTRDNILEYQATKDVTQIEVIVKGNEVGQVKNHKEPGTGTMNGDPIILTVNGKLKPVPVSSTKTTSTGKNATDKTVANKSDKDSGGMGTAGKVGVGVAAAGALAFGASRLLGGSGKAGTGSGPAGAAETEAGASAAVSEKPESFVFTDPATGAQTLYEKDPETGEWVNPLTGGVVDVGDLDRFARQREADADWTRNQMEKLSNRDTDLDRAWREQAVTHPPQRMHSAAPGFPTGSTPMGQALWHLPQATQASGSTFAT